MWDIRACITLATILQSMSITTTVEQKHLRWQLWCLNLGFEGQRIWWSNLFLPMTFKTFAISNFRPYFGSSVIKHCQKLKGSLLVIRTWDIGQCVMLATILQKYTFGHNFWTKPLRMMILVPWLLVLWSKNFLVPFILMNDLDLLKLWPLQSHS